MRQQAALLAALAFAGGQELPVRREEPPTPAQRKRWAAQRDYPASGTEKRQGERLARQMARGLLDFSASDKCIARIRERLAQGLEK